MKKEMNLRKLKLTRETLTQLEDVLGGSVATTFASKVKTNCESDLCPTRTIEF